MQCKYCGTNNPEGSAFCGSCGASLADSNQAGYSAQDNASQTQDYQGYNNQGAYTNQNNVQGANPSRDGSLGIASMIVGILSLITCSAYGGFIFGVAAIVLSCLDKKPSSYKKAGLILGIIGVVLGAVLLGITFVTRTAVEKVGEQLVDYIEEERAKNYIDTIGDGEISKDSIKSDLLGEWTEYGERYYSNEGSRWVFDDTYAYNYFDETDNGYVRGTYEIVSIYEGAEMADTSKEEVDQILAESPSYKTYRYFTVVVTPDKYVESGDAKSLDSITDKGIYLWATKEEGLDTIAEVNSTNSAYTRRFIKK